MQENRDPMITLFGKKIPLSSEGDVPSEGSGEDADPQTEMERNGGDGETQEEKSQKESSVDKQRTDSDKPRESDQETSIAKPEVNPESKSGDDKSRAETNNSSSDQKTLKKPDKILPCPRCNSMDTKFCYYNNYNVNQPRHFCKACQRYWTAGGTMRNVPVGAGRRKNKNSASHYRHITISEALQAARVEGANGLTHPGLKSNGRVLSFGVDTHSPICDSMASVLKLGADAKVLNGVRNGFQESSVDGNCSNGSTTGTSGLTEEKKGYNDAKHVNGFGPPVPCLPGVPWPYTWNSPIAPPPGFFPSGIPMPIYPAAYWTVPLLSPQSSSSSSSQMTGGSSPNSPTLGKHSRDGETFRKEELEKEESPRKNGCVLVPKTLRIDDPNEAAKSSIWATLGIKNESLSKGGGMFRGFQKTDEKKTSTSHVLQANPAALSRSLQFHERT